MPSSISPIFLAIFCLVQLAMYLAIRRRWPATTAIVTGGVLISIAAIAFTGISTGSSTFQALFAGLVVGGIVSAVVLGMAAYFSRTARPAPSESELDTSGDTATGYTNPTPAGEAPSAQLTPPIVPPRDPQR